MSLGPQGLCGRESGISSSRRFNCARPESPNKIPDVRAPGVSWKMQRTLPQVQVGRVETRKEDSAENDRDSRCKVKTDEVGLEESEYLSEKPDPDLRGNRVDSEKCLGTARSTCEIFWGE